MPSVFTKNGFRFFFYSNDHTPIHVHVRKGGAEAVFEIGTTVHLRESVGMKVKDLEIAQRLAVENRNLIIQKWNEHLG